MKIIATNSWGYQEIRNFAGLNTLNYQFKRVWDVFRLVNGVRYKITGESSDTLAHSFCDLGANRVGAYHFMNAIPITNKPFFITFEKSLPRLSTKNKWYKNMLVRRLAQPNCQKLIGFSEFAKNMCIAHFQAHYPSMIDDILPKIIALHPAQKMCIDDYSDKQLDVENIVFTIVGADFFRKGGKEVLQVFDELLTENTQKNIRLNIVSTLQYGDYATQATEADQLWALKIIRKYGTAITHHKYLGNDAVLALLKNTHVALLPTYAETYGYSVLEAQACGCPVITTDIESLPEVNDNDIGWQINIPKDRLGYSLHATAAQRAAVAAAIAQQLKSIIENILQNPALIQHKAEKSMQKIREKHDFDTVSTQIKKLYDQALNQ